MHAPHFKGGLQYKLNYSKTLGLFFYSRELNLKNVLMKE